jgi:hypothetical protein
MDYMHSTTQRPTQGRLRSTRRLDARRTLAVGLAALSMAVVCGVGTTPASAIAPPNDPLYAQQIAPGGALSLIHEPAALATIGQTPLHDVLVTNLDTGIDLANPDLASRLTTVPAGTPAPLTYGGPPTGPSAVPTGGSPGWDMLGFAAQPVDGSVAPDADPTDPAGRTGHGTEVAGVLGQAFNNGFGGVGVAPNARFLAMRSCWDFDDCFGSIQADAAPWAVARGVRVISMSWGCCDVNAGAPWGDGYDTAIHNATNTLFVAIPGGNGGATLAPDTRRPCGDPSPNVLCVSTSSPTDGLDCGEYSPTIVDLAVPTQNNVTTFNGGPSGPTGCATSLASPAAAGAAAVLFGLDPAATPADVKQALIDSARQVPAWAGKSVSGGILDLDAAVKLFAQRRGIALIPDPVVPPPPPPLPPPPPPPLAPSGRDRIAPLLSLLRLSHTRFTAAGGALLTVTLSEPATLTLRMSRTVRGARVGHVCRARTAARRRAACTRYVSVTTKHLRGLGAGTSRVRFRARTDGGTAVAAGRYRAITTAADAAGNRSSSRTLRFTVTAAR